MTLITRFCVTFLLLTATLVAAQPSNKDHKENPKDCKKSEFWYQKKHHCLPRGGPHKKPPPPPPHKKCPPHGWYWHDGHKACMPHYPPPPHPSPPKCPKNWIWSEPQWCCEPHKPPHKPPPHHPPPKPSHKPKGPGGYGKRDLKQSVGQICPGGLDACPIPGVSGITGDFECLDTAVELESCGGCSAVGEGQDCTAIEGVWNVGCEKSSCAVYSCMAGYQVSHDRTTCLPL